MPVEFGNKGLQVQKTDGSSVSSSNIAPYRKRHAAANGLCFVSEDGHRWDYISAAEFLTATGITAPDLSQGDYSGDSTGGSNTSARPMKAAKAVKVEVDKLADAPISDEQKTFINFIHKEAVSLRPPMLKMKDLPWKTLVREVKRGSNIMMTGPAGSGKTMAARAAAASLGFNFHYFNMGSMQDARSGLIGNLHFHNGETTLVESEFIQAIQKPNTVILLDEVTRSNHDAWNILMTVLDKGQRYVRLDEASAGTNRVINVCESVAFIATANIGVEYTATRVMDKALLDRFKIIEMEVLSAKDEATLLKEMFPTLNRKVLEAIGDIAGATREECKREDSRLSTIISTRMTVEIASLLYDGFTLAECAETTIYPFYSPQGGAESERVYVSQLVQKHMPTNVNWDNLFEDQTQAAPITIDPATADPTPAAASSSDLFTVDDLV